MISALARIGWDQRDLTAPVLAVLLVGGTVLGTLATFAGALGEEGDVGSLVTIGAIALVCTAVVLRAITRHGVAERWVTARRLRVVGLSGRSLRTALLAETTVLALAAAATALVLARYAAVPLLQPYLAGLGVVPDGLRPGWSTVAVLLTVAGALGASLVGAAGAARTLATAEPASSEPPTRTSRRHPVVRVAGLGGAVALGALLVRSMTTTTSDETAFLLGMLAAICAIVVVCASWDPLVRAAGRLRERVDRAALPTGVLVADRWRRRQHQVTVVVATSIATVLCLYLAGYPAATEQIASARLHAVLDGTAVAQPSAVLGREDARALLQDGDGVVVADGAVEIAVAGAEVDPYAPRREQPVTIVGGVDGAAWLEQLTGQPTTGHGAVITRQLALRDGLEPGDRLALSLDGVEVTQVPVAGVTAMPATFTDYYLVGEEVEALASGDALVLVDRAEDAPTGWTVTDARGWVDALAPGAAVSSTGGSGTSETPLLVGAPLALCLTLAIAATASTTAGRRTDLRTLDLIGATRGQSLGAVLRSATTDVLGAGLVSAALALALLGLALRPFAETTGAPVGLAWAQAEYVLVPVTIWASCLIAGTVAWSAVRRRAARVGSL